MGGGFGHGGGDLGFFDLLLVFGQGRGQFQTFPGSEGNGPIPQTQRLGRLGVFDHEFLVELERLLGFVIATVELGEFDEQTKTVAGFTIPDEIQGLVVQLGGILLFIEIAINIGAPFKNDLILWKILDEFGHGGFGFGQGPGIAKEADFAQTKPREIRGVGGLGAVEILVKVTWKRPIERIPHHRDHPGERELGLVGGFRERQTREQGAYK